MYREYNKRYELIGHCVRKNNVFIGILSILFSRGVRNQRRNRLLVDIAFATNVIENFTLLGKNFLRWCFMRTLFLRCASFQAWVSRLRKGTFCSTKSASALSSSRTSSTRGWQYSLSSPRDGARPRLRQRDSRIRWETILSDQLLSDKILVRPNLFTFVWIFSWNAVSILWVCAPFYSRDTSITDTTDTASHTSTQCSPFANT